MKTAITLIVGAFLLAGLLPTGRTKSNADYNESTQMIVDEREIARIEQLVEDAQKRCTQVFGNNSLAHLGYCSTRTGWRKAL